MVKTVLIVDDNAFVRRALGKLLTRELGVEVREAQNGKEAIDKAGELQPDLIVLDISMPLMNGRQRGRLRVYCLRYRSFCTAPSLMHSQRKRLT
jgi:CheY-like chemotaxis protein